MSKDMRRHAGVVPGHIHAAEQDRGWTAASSTPTRRRPVSNPTAMGQQRRRTTCTDECTSTTRQNTITVRRQRRTTRNKSTPTTTSQQQHRTTCQRMHVDDVTARGHGTTTTSTKTAHGLARTNVALGRTPGTTMVPNDVHERRHVDVATGRVYANENEGRAGAHRYVVTKTFDVNELTYIPKLCSITDLGTTTTINNVTEQVHANEQERSFANRRYVIPVHSNAYEFTNTPVSFSDNFLHQGSRARKRSPHQRQERSSAKRTYHARAIW